MTKKNSSNLSQPTENIEQNIENIENKEPVLSALSGIFIVLVTILADIGISRYILHEWENLSVNLTYIIYETVITVVCSAGLIVFLNYIRVGEACEKAESIEEFPCGGPFGFLAGNPVVLWIEVSLIVGILFTGFNGVLFKLLGFETWNTVVFLIYKFFYSCIMVALTHWMVLGRMLQPDWLQKNLNKKAHPIAPKTSSKASKKKKNKN